MWVFKISCLPDFWNACMYKWEPKDITEMTILGGKFLTASVMPFPGCDASLQMSGAGCLELAGRYWLWFCLQNCVTDYTKNIRAVTKSDVEYSPPSATSFIPLKCYGIIRLHLKLLNAIQV